MSHSRESSTGPFGTSWSKFFPFSSSALASLPDDTSRPARYTREDDPATIRNYNSIQSLPPNVRVPRKVSTAVKVEGKVWFANERSLSRSSRLISHSSSSQPGSLGSMLPFSSERLPSPSSMPLVILSHVLLHMCTLSLVLAFWYVSSGWPSEYLCLTTFEIYGFYLYQSRITMIRKRDPGHYGPSSSLLCGF